jgi:hypothetical protein
MIREESKMRTSPLARYPQSPLQPQLPINAEATLDRATARAMVDAGYMSLRSYIEQFGFDPAGEGEVVETGDHCLRQVH